MDNANVKRKTETKYRLDNILIIDFLNAIDKNDPTIINENMTTSELEDLYIDFDFEFRDAKEDFVRIQTEEYEFEIIKLVSLINLLDIFWGDETRIKRVLDMFSSYGFEISINTIEEDLKAVESRIKSMERKLKQLKINNVQMKNGGKTNIYLTIARMSKSLGFDLQHDKLTIIKFIYYIKTLKENE